MRLPSPTPLRDAEADFVWVIVPFSRPENLERVLSNFQRQKFPFKRLVLVENGRALGAASRVAGADSSWLRVLSSERHQSIAKNTALREIRRWGGGFTVVMDDDDWYGPQFLTEACGYAKTYDVIGKERHFVGVSGGLWLCHRERANGRGGALNGGTIACWAETAPEYPLVSYGEDAMFCSLAMRQGQRIYATDIYHYLYRRDETSDHAWHVTVEQLRGIEASSGALDLGAENLDVVSGIELEVDARPLSYTEDLDTLRPSALGGVRVAS